MSNQPERPSLISEGDYLESDPNTKIQKGSKSSLQQVTAHNLTFSEKIASSETCALKLLVSNNVAGRIIGKAGQFVSQLQSDCGCRIKLSQSNHYFPGTHDRVCLLEGKVLNLHLALDAIYEKISEQTSTSSSQHLDEIEEGSIDRAEKIVVCLLVPTASCGMLIGKGGNHIKEMSDKSGAKIQLAQKDEATTIATSERVVTITANIDAAITCTMLILDDMISHPDVFKYSNQTTSYSKVVSSEREAKGHSDSNAHDQSRHQRSHHHQSDNQPLDYFSSPSSNIESITNASLQTHQQPYSVQMTVPDEVVPALIGRNRSGVADLQSRSGARIIFSDRGDFVPGTTNRKVEIIGSNMESCATAQYFISQIVRSQVIENQHQYRDRNEPDVYDEQHRRGRYNPSTGGNTNTRNSRR